MHQNVAVILRQSCYSKISFIVLVSPPSLLLELDVVLSPSPPALLELDFEVSPDPSALLLELAVVLSPPPPALLEPELDDSVVAVVNDERKLF